MRLRRASFATQSVARPPRALSRISTSGAASRAHRVTHIGPPVAMESHGVLSAITSASSFLEAQQRIVAAESLSGSQRSMTASLVLQIGQLSELSNEDATMLSDAIEASAFDQESKSTLATAVGTKLASGGRRATAGPVGQSCINIKDFTWWHRHSANYR